MSREKMEREKRKTMGFIWLPILWWFCSLARWRFSSEDCFSCDYELCMHFSGLFFFFFFFLISSISWFLSMKYPCLLRFSKYCNLGLCPWFFFFFLLQGSNPQFPSEFTYDFHVCCSSKGWFACNKRVNLYLSIM